jgi:predicted DNA-binding antitoxin AbrB/MazE fold protein
MVQVVRAVYENGVLRPLEGLDLEEHEQVRVTVESLASKQGACSGQQEGDPLDGVRVSTGIPDLAEHFNDYRFGRRKP